MSYIIKKKMNNNVVLVEDSEGNQEILIGNGIGFDAKVNREFTQKNRVKQTFILKDETNKEKFKDVIENTDAEKVAFLEEQIGWIQEELNAALNESIHVTFIDHILFAIVRHENNMDFRNPLDFDISLIYGEEYHIAEELLKKINERFLIDLSHDEVGLLAIHIHAARKDEKISNSESRIKLIQDIIQIIYDSFDAEIDKSKLVYQRLLLHIRYAIERIVINKPLKSDLEDMIKESYQREYSIVEKAMNRITEKYGITIPESEICYLVLHSIRVIDESKSSKE